MRGRSSRSTAISSTCSRGPIHYADQKASEKAELTTAIEWCDGTVNPVIGCDGYTRLIFVVDMGDGFTASVDPDDWLTAQLGMTAAGPARLAPADQADRPAGQVRQ